MYGSVTASLTAFKTNTATPANITYHVGSGDVEDMMVRC